MTNALLLRLAALDRRAFAALLAAGVLFVALEAWLLVLRAPLAEWRSLVALRQAGQAAAAPGALAAEVERLGEANRRLERELDAAAPPRRSADDAVLFLIGALDRLGARHGVSLGAVRPGARTIVQGFEATTFEIEARGNYLALSDWLREARAAIAPLTPAEMSMTVADEDRRVVLKMNVNAHAQPTGASAGTP